MKVLLLCRQANGGMWSWARALQLALDKADLVAAEDWMPLKTGAPIDKSVSEHLRKLSAGYDLVHAFGYRCAWACAEALRKPERPWVFSPYEPPKTRHPDLAERLRRAALVVAPSYFVRDEVRGFDLRKLKVVEPPATIPAERSDSFKEEVGVFRDQQLLLAFVPEARLQEMDLLAEAMESVFARVPTARMAVVRPELSQCHREQLGSALTVVGRVENPVAAMSAADLVVVPTTSKGFSYVALEAMAAGSATLLKRSGGLVEQGEENLNAFFFTEDSDLGNAIGGTLQMPTMMDAVGRAGQVRAQTHHEPVQISDQLLELYQEAVDK